MKCNGQPIKDLRPHARLDLASFADVPEDQQEKILTETRRVWARAFGTNGRMRPLETFGEAVEKDGLEVRRKRLIFLLTQDGIGVHHPFKEQIWNKD
ncbi:hypothetical protein KKA95_00815 [Patescibacteria group bacterium]|nr:hypothetical protein [Patescibacteria group bacterium]